MPEPTPLGLDTICDGQIPALFERELRAILDNIADPNTDPEKTRSLSITVNIKPLQDRSGMVLVPTVKSKLVPVKAAGSTCFLSRHTGRLEAYGIDTRQGVLFGQSAEPPAVASDSKVVNLKS